MWSDAKDSAAKAFVLSAVAWFGLGSLLGVILALKMVWPGFLGGVAWLQFGRVRPVHINSQLFGWLSMAQVGVTLYIVPRLTRSPLYSERLGHVTVWAWNAAVVLAVITLLMGITQGREYAELVWWLDVAVLAVVILSGFNVFMTIRQRRERQLYVSLWYFMGSFVWLPLVYTIGNWPTFSGVNEANINWFYGHNVLGLWFTTLGLGIVYYLLPKESGNPIFSHRLSLIGFWTIGLFYIWTGAHHLIWGPVPHWLQTVAIAFSVLLIIPVTTVVVNFLATMEGKWPMVVESMPVRLFVTGTVFYLITCLQGPAQSLRSLSQLVKFTNWVPAHAHLALFSTFSFIAWGGLYYILPRLYRREGMHSAALMEWHYWLSLLGFSAFSLAMWAVSLVQGSLWAAGVPFEQVVAGMRPYQSIRAVGGTAMLLGQLVFLYNVIMTARGQPSRAPAVAEGVV